jgi:poly-beta-1,6-N-acetyl-D-glucosamine synthase
MNTELIAFIIIIAFATVAAIQLFYYFFIYGKILFIKNKLVETKSKEPVSIVICARNEQENLEKYLPKILEQDYPDFEVVVVNDCSADETEDVLKRLSLKYKHLRYTYIKEDEKFTHGKKLALTVGIKSAKHEWLLLTDADCFPEGKDWLAGMASHFKDNVSIVLGYGGFTRRKGLLNRLIRFDAMFIALQYFTFALFGSPYMGVGRNLAYRKSLFFQNKGFASHARLSSGDDDLFINEVGKSGNVTVETGKNAVTRSEPKITFSQWVEQKSRHFTTFGRYKMKHKILLGTEVISRVLFYFLFVASIVLKLYLIIALSIFGARLIIQYIVYKNTAKRLGEKKLLLTSLLFDIFLPFFNFGIYLSNKFRPQRQWR